MKFEEKLVQLRKGNKLSQEQLAEKLGVSRQAISRWESGDSTPDITNLLGICKCFEVSSDYLIYDDYQPEEEKVVALQKLDAKQAGRAKRKIFHFSAMICFVISALIVAFAGSFGGSLNAMVMLLSFLFLSIIQLFFWLCL